MANGGTITGLLSEQRGAIGLIAVVATTMAGALGAGLSAYYQAQTRAYTDEQIAHVIEDRIRPRLEARKEYTDFRYQNLNERLGEVEAIAKENAAEFRKVWSAIAERPDRQAWTAVNADDLRRLDRLESEVETLKRALYGRRSQNP